MPSTTDSIADRKRFADLLSEKLVAVVQEHQDLLLEYENEELRRSRTEVLQLRGEITKINEEMASIASMDALQAKGKRTNLSDRDLYLTLSDDRVSGQLEASKDIDPKLTGRASRSKQHRITFSGDTKLDQDEIYKQAAARESSGHVTLRGFENNLSNPNFSRSVQHVRSVKESNSEMMDLKKKFHDLDPDNKGYVDIALIAEYMTCHLADESDEKATQMQRYRTAIHKLNKHIGILSQTITDERATRREHLEFPAFEILMLEEISTLQDHFELEWIETLIEIRRALVHDVVRQQIAKACNVAPEEVYNRPLSTFVFSIASRTILQILEPTAAVMIMVNALFLGISLDVDPYWDGWFAVEVFFMVFFFAELLIRIRVHGCIAHFFGDSWCWHWFDCVLVISAILDIFVTILYKSGLSKQFQGMKLNHFLLIRVVRLLRVTRIIRMFRLRMFKELTLMLDGVIAGLRTLFWAIVLLTIVIYALGLVMRQVMDPEEAAYACVASSINMSESCNRGEAIMDEYGNVMFGSVPRSMLTIFICFTDGCNGPDGSPLLWHVWDSHGPFLVMVYVVAFMFVTFGILNLIMAVFVENTLANAQERAAERHGLMDGVQKAKRLHMLVAKFLKGSQPMTPVGSSLKSLKSKRSSKRSVESANQDQQLEHWQMRITQDQFEGMMQDKDVHDILDDLDISCISRDQLFDILDADGNGFLAISELVDGIIKLRGPADKGIAVATVLAVRQLQKQVSYFQRSMLKQFQMSESLQTQTSPCESESSTFITI